MSLKPKRIYIIFIPLAGTKRIKKIDTSLKKKKKKRFGVFFRKMEATNIRILEKIK